MVLVDMGHRLAVVMPARNEEAHLEQVLRSLPDEIDGCDSIEAVVVDDGSTDATASVAEGLAALVRHAISLGKGAALRTGCEAAIRRGCTLMAVMDADGQHEPGDLPRLVRPLVTGDADLVVAYRSFDHQMPPAMRLGNWALSNAFGALFGERFRDTQCGLRAFTRAAYDRLRWRSLDYSVETEMLIRAARGGVRVTEVPIATVYHDQYKGTTVLDGFGIFANMLRWRLADVR